MDDNDHLVTSFMRDLRAKDRSPKTLENYGYAIAGLIRFTDGKPLLDLTPDVARDFFADLLQTRSASTAANRQQALIQFYKWAVGDDLIPVSPLARLGTIKKTDSPVPVLTIDQVVALLKACEGKTFAQIRDTAMVRLFLEPGGPRLAEMAGMTLPSLDMVEDAVTVVGKGRKERTMWFGAKTGQALDRYLRARRSHPHRALDALWLGRSGVLRPNGIQQLLVRRATTAGIGHLHPHMLRHTAAHEFLNAGGQETDALKLFGWRNRDMLAKYGAAAAVARARDASRRMKLGDRY